MQSSTAPQPQKFSDELAEIRRYSTRILTGIPDDAPHRDAIVEDLGRIKTIVDLHECKAAGAIDESILTARKAAIIGAAGACIAIGAVCLAIGFVVVQWQSDTILSGIEI